MDDTFMTMKEMVTEIRSDVKELRAQIDRIDRQGSIGTRQDLEDHETRLRGLEQWRWGIPAGFLSAVGMFLAAIFGGVPHQ